MTHDIRQSRRTVLKSAAATSIFGNLIGSVSASSNDSELIFSEIGFSAHIDLPSDSELNYPTVAVDEPRFHEVKEDQSLYLSNLVSDQIREAFTRSSHIMYSDRYLTEKGDLSRSTNLVPLSFTRSGFRTTMAIELAEVQPLYEDVYTYYDGDTLILSNGKRSTEINPGDEFHIKLDTFSAPVTAWRVLDELVDNRNIPQRLRARKTVDEKRSATVTPAITIRNNGLLELK